MVPAFRVARDFRLAPHTARRALGLRGGYAGAHQECAHRALGQRSALRIRCVERTREARDPLLRRAPSRRTAPARGRAQPQARGIGFRLSPARRPRLRAARARGAAGVGAAGAVPRHASRGEPQAQAVARGVLGRAGPEGRRRRLRERVSRGHAGRAGRRAPHRARRPQQRRGACRLAHGARRGARALLGGRGRGHGAHAPGRRARTSHRGAVLRDRAAAHGPARRRERREPGRPAHAAVGCAGGRGPGRGRRRPGMTRIAYALAWWIATPFILLRLAWRARRQRGYLDRVGERFGIHGRVERVPRIWVHAVSVGETRAAAPLIEQLRARYPRHRILLTHMTPTGRATGEELFGDRVERAWLPYDYGFAVRGFLEAYSPAAGILMETEVWPRLIEESARARVPVVLANARLSERSARRYARVAGFTRRALSQLAGIAAQSEADAERFERLGAARPAVTGNIKFDVAVPDEMIARGQVFRQRFGASRSVWVVGSTRDGEEALLLEAFAAAHPGPAALLVLVPRHPQRFDEVAALAARQGFACERRSAGGEVAATTQVLVGDSMGEMLAYYAAADIVIMGGSLLAFGSQNLIEACALGKPVIVGPSTYNFEEAAASAIAAGAALRVSDARQAIEAASALAADGERRARMGESAQAFVAAHRGAVDRLADWLATRIPA